MVTLELADTAHDRPRAATASAADGPFADGMPLDDSNLVAEALRLAGRDGARAPRQAHPARRRARRRLGRRRCRAALGRLRRRRRRPSRLGADVSLLPASAGGPGCRASARWSSRCRPSTLDITLVIPPLGREHPGRLPGVGRARRADGRRPERPRAGGRSWWSRGWPAGATGSREAAGAAPDPGRQRRDLVRARAITTLRRGPARRDGGA